MGLERQQEQQEVVMMMMAAPDDEVNAGLVVRRRNEPDEFVSLFVAGFHLRLLNFRSIRGGLLQVVVSTVH